MTNVLHLGLDIGSTTIKQVYLDAQRKIVHASYERHFSEVQSTLATMLERAATTLQNPQIITTITGSAGMGLSETFNIPFVQEVLASSLSIQTIIPRTNVAIELGGEDAKITFFDGSIDQRMNETCAGGTGAFIDQMAVFLRTDAQGLNELAKEATTIYPIAARCGVFAKADITPLLNEGAKKSDIAASIFQAVVDQTIGGLACGREIKGNVAFLGGPLFYLSELRYRFIESLKLTPEQIIFPENAQLFVALGAALESLSIKKDSTCGIRSLADLAKEVAQPRIQNTEKENTLTPLFANISEEYAFQKRHTSITTPRGELASHQGAVFLGFDIGSTTIKAVLINEQGELLYTHYERTHGAPLDVAVSLLKSLYAQLPKNAFIGRCATTGYGSSLLLSAFTADFEEVETVAHYKAANQLHPKVSFILDIGGQDMKCLHVKNGVVDKIMLNEACSAGCGAFIETFAESLGMKNSEFTAQALASKQPVDLGSRCTVFMNSKVKQAQKEGASVGDIAAGLAYSVIKNALYKVIKVANVDDLGSHVIAQGGAFLNDALLRAFELLLGKEIFRPDISGLMGAYGVALLAKEQYCLHNILENQEKKSRIISSEMLNSLAWEVKNTRCKACTNHCLLTHNIFTNGHHHISGNKCEIGVIAYKKKKKEKRVPNLYKEKNQRLFAHYTPLSLEDASRGVIGIPRALNMYENYPFWFTFFTKLGYRVELSDPTTKKLYNTGIATIPSQTVCYPAKLAHGHVLNLVEKGINDIFFPSITYEEHEFLDTDSNYNCPVVIGYPELLMLNIDALAKNHVTMHVPFLPLSNHSRLLKRMQTEILHFPNGKSINKKELTKALDSASREMNSFRSYIKSAGERALQNVLETKGEKSAIILAGHPYHVDPGVHHGISSMISEMGVTVLTEDSIAHLAPPPQNLRVVNQWTYHARLYRAATLASLYPQVYLVQLTSFGCGLDAITSDQVQEILEDAGKISTLIKIDEGANLGAARIRIRSLIAAEEVKRHADLEEHKKGQCKALKHNSIPNTMSYNKPLLLSMKDITDAVHPKVLSEKAPQEKKSSSSAQRVSFTDEMKKTHTILVPQVSPIHFQFVEKALESEGYHAKLLPTVEKEALERGLHYVNNDACYPALLTVGQLMHAVESNNYDKDKIALILSQTGGGCRATNYIAFLRKALASAGLSHIPVLSFNINGLEKNPGFRITTSLLKKCLRGLMYGDLLARLYYRTRPYEVHKGDAQRVLESMSNLCRAHLCDEKKKSFSETIKHIVQTFANIPVNKEKKPRVGIVGEIYLKYNPDANNKVMDFIEQEGGEAVPTDLVTFILYTLHNDIFDASSLDGSKIKALKNHVAIWWIEKMRDVMRSALKSHPRFGKIETLTSLQKKATSLIQLGHQTGEGWLLPAEMLEFIESDIRNIICLQPFGCLPNHIIGKGVIKEIKRHYPEANITAIDYDAGASEVNQLNRIKLMMGMAHKNIV